jgi:hypothetical protein
VEKLLLGRRLSLQKLDVVDEKDVEVAIARLEGLAAGGLQRRNELVGERLGGGVASAEGRGVVAQVVGDRRQQVGLPQAWWAVQEKGIVGLRGSLGDGKRGAVGKPVARTDHEALEGVVRVQLRMALE